MVNQELPANFHSEQDFECLFKALYKPLVAYAYTTTKDESTAEEIVQNVFTKLWTKRFDIEVESSLKAYLYKAVYFESMNMIKHNKIKAKHLQHMSRENYTENYTDRAGLKQLEQRIFEALKDLPEQCRTIFMMSRFEELKYREIADQLQLSVKTVENQMGKALKVMRGKLAEYLTIILTIITLFKN